MSDTIQFPPLLGFTLIIITISLILVVLLFTLQIAMKKTKEKPQITKKEYPAFATEILEKALQESEGQNPYFNFFVYICELLSKSFQIDGTMFLLYNTVQGDYEVKACAGIFPSLNLEAISEKITLHQFFEDNDIKCSQAFFKDVHESKVCTQSFNQKNTIIQSVSNPDINASFASYITIPLNVENELTLKIVVVRKDDSFSEEDIIEMKQVATYVQLGVKTLCNYDILRKKNKSETEANIASEIQKKMHSSKLPVLKGIDMAHIFESRFGVCSDYFDAIKLKKNSVCVAFVDVPGSPVTSLLVIQLIRSLVRFLINTKNSCSTLMSWINTALIKDNIDEHFANVTLFYYNEDTQIISCSCAGDNPVLHYDSLNKKWEQLSNKTDPLGISVNSAYNTVEKKLKKDDLVILFSDGLVDVLNENGDQYSTEKLKKNIEKSSTFSAKEIAELTKHGIIEYMGKRKSIDDASLFVLKIK